ncbi:MAG: VanW family protein [Bacteroidota bacterium]
MNNWRSYIPSSLKLRIRLIRRQISDRQKGFTRQFAQKQISAPPLAHQVFLEQPIRPSALVENKIHNLHTGAQRIAEFHLQAGQIFSFWRAIGPATAQNGFKKGRNILSGQLSADYGGGLCQLSGMIYYLSLRYGLEIVERHAHSIDIYTDESRYTPLGTDAAVVYAYKDLRIRNNQLGPIRFVFTISPQKIVLALQSSQVMSPQKLSFQQKQNHLYKEVFIRNQKQVLLGHSKYKLS